MATWLTGILRHCMVSVFVCLVLLSCVACQDSTPSQPTVPPEVLAALLATVPPSPTATQLAPGPVQALLSPTSQTAARVPIEAITATPSLDATPLAGQTESDNAPRTMQQADGLSATIIEVVDGDTLLVEVADGRREIGYWGCHVPKDITTWQQKQCTAANRVLMAGGDVRIERDPLADAAGVERYYVWDGNLLINAELVRMGYAQVSQDLAGSRYEALLLDHQDAAQSAGLGIWAELPTSTPEPSLTPQPTDSEITSTPQPEPTLHTTVQHEPTALSPTTAPTSTPAPTDAPTIVASETPLPVATEPVATSTPAPTDAPPPTSEPAVGGQVAITYVFCDGVEGRTEPDEYCELTNQGNQAVQLEGWLLNAGAQGQDVVLPAFVLAPGQVCRVYTNEVHDEWGGLSFASGRALWKNSGDCGYLYDAEGVEQSSYCYD